MDREDIAWAAGLLEGEGSLQWKERQGAPAMALSMTDEDVVRRFHRIIGLGSVGGPYQYTSHRKPFWNWQVGGFPTVQAVIAMLYPWLGDRRRAKAREILAKGRATKGKTLLWCRKGLHEFTPENTYTRRDGMGRMCRPCRAEAHRDWQLRRKALGRLPGPKP